jgi:SAM-dependent methyltransferase
MTRTVQRDVFLSGEADAYFQRNEAAYSASSLDRESLPLRVVSRYVAQQSTVLEIGCANGANLDRLRGSTGCSGAGVDPSASAIRKGLADFPGLDLRRATADALPFADTTFDVVWFGFCLYVTDRPLLPRVVAEADRVLKNLGYLVIVDFDPPHPVCRDYHHAAGVTTYKTDHSKMFLGFPQYVLVEKQSFSHAGSTFTTEADERLAIYVLHKDNDSGYGRID